MLKPALQEDAREAIEKFARDTADGGPAVLVGQPVGEGRQALQRLPLSRRRQDRRHHAEIRPAELRRVRREARLRARPAARAVRHPRRAHRRADLRGHLDAPRSPNAWPRPARRFSPCPTARPTRRQGRCAPQPHRCAGQRDEAAADLSQPGRRAGRTRVPTAILSSSTPIIRSRSRCRRGKNASL